MTRVLPFKVLDALEMKMYIDDNSQVMESACMMPEKNLSESDRAYLLELARKSIENYANNRPLPEIDKNSLSPILRSNGACFVTLTIQGYLRGCVGALDAYQSIAEDVCEHAIAAAFQDYRFPPIQTNEINQIEIEISYLTQPKLLDYSDSLDLIDKLKPNIDGIVIKDGMHRATFLPQVWEKIPNTEEFLSQLCMKMGTSPDLWRRKKLVVSTYQVEEFHEKS